MRANDSMHFETRINTWAQIVGIILASAWGIYTFIYKEVLVPKSAPTNISVDLQLEAKRGRVPTNTDEDLSIVELKAEATNPSSRMVYLLTSAFIVFGTKIDSELQDSEPFFDKITSTSIQRGSASFLARHSKVQRPEVIALGELFPYDDVLKPGETIARTMMIYVPTGEYDSLEGFVLVPSVGQPTEIFLEWKYDPEQWLQPMMYRRGQNQEPILITKDAPSRYAELESDLQQATGSTQVALVVD